MITMNRENESERKDNPMSSTENPKLRKSEFLGIEKKKKERKVHRKRKVKS